MQKEDRCINDRCGTVNHFKVPKGYFDNLTASVMQHIPDNEAKVVRMQPSVWHRSVVAISAAAASVAVAVCLALSVDFSTTDNKLSAHAEQQQTEYSDVDAMVNYTMLDNDDMYAYMSGAE